MRVDELEAEFEDCASRVLPAGRIAAAWELLSRLEMLPDVGELTAALALEPARARAAGA